MEESMAESQLEQSRAESQSRLKSLRSILSTAIKTMPREELIKLLKEKKIIRYEYSEEKKDVVLIEKILGGENPKGKDKLNWTNYCATNNNRNQCSNENCTMFPICLIKNIPKKQT